MKNLKELIEGHVRILFPERPKIPSDNFNIKVPEVLTYRDIQEKREEVSSYDFSFEGVS